MPNHTTIAEPAENEITVSLPSISTKLDTTRYYILSTSSNANCEAKEYSSQAIPVSFENLIGDHNYNILAPNFETKPLLCVNNGVVTTALNADESSTHSFQVNVENNTLKSSVEVCTEEWTKTAKMSILPVRCKNTSGYFYKGKFGSGGKGKCIESDGKWFTPTEFEAFSGKASSKDWKRSIKFGGKPLHWLIKQEIILPHAVSCTCSSCCDSDCESSGPVRIFTPYQRNKRPRKDKNKQNASSQNSSKKKSNKQTNSISEHSDASKEASSELDLILQRINAVTETLMAVTKEVTKCQQYVIQLDRKFGSKKLSEIPKLVEIEDCESMCENCSRPAIGGCGKCYGIGYCSVFCQKRDWNSHKADCLEHSNIEIIS